MKTQGERIKELRESRKMTQEALGKAVGTTKQTIFKYETGKIENIPYSRLLAIADALGADPLEIIGWKEADEGDDKELEEETGSEVLGESVSDAEDNFSDEITEPEVETEEE